MLSGLASCNYPAFTGEEGSILQPNLISLNSLQSCPISQGIVHILLSAPRVPRSWEDLARSPIETRQRHFPSPSSEFGGPLPWAVAHHQSLQCHTEVEAVVLLLLSNPLLLGLISHQEGQAAGAAI